MSIQPETDTIVTTSFILHQYRHIKSEEFVVKKYNLAVSEALLLFRTVQGRVSSTSHRGGYCHGAVVHALQKCGVRHIDTAKRYGCEHLLQRAIRESGVKREDLWITTKLWHSDYGYDNTKKACLESCERLGVEYLDLYLIHWPDAQVPGKSNREVRAETWRAMEELYEKGLCKSIGVSNFLISHLEQLKEDCVITPHVNQLVTFPLLTGSWQFVIFLATKGLFHTSVPQCDCFPAQADGDTTQNTGFAMCNPCQQALLPRLNTTLFKDLRSWLIIVGAEILFLKATVL
ncbi:uncharacterized oxidoreductase ZK1290.5-like [Ammospiza nelsoni]|uniref:uncharacterized oxidoreductase ZK1290.5-like n=1 Tax=Ammospiza nelsoni TaxID=2857394 RepID=UPI00286ACD7C|nr:uncharacterized oxidoreductase ZK1290.5-like [Ammospiza nelsoni]